jgi:hypothetical protein
VVASKLHYAALPALKVHSSIDSERSFVWDWYGFTQRLDPYRLNMSIQFLLFVIAILLVSIFWVLSKINSLLKKTLLTRFEQHHEVPRKEVAAD